MADKREYRLYPISEGEIRSDEESGKISGFAAVFNQAARIFDFDEEVLPGAFSKSINDRADVFAFWNHETGKVLGRVKNNTLELREDDHGLFFDATPPDTSVANDARIMIRDGYVDKASFGFEVIKQNWIQREGQVPLRQLQEVRLFDVSPVSIPAYSGTAISARGFGHKPEVPRPPEPEPEPEPALHSAVLLNQLRRRAILRKKREQNNAAKTV